MARFTYVKKARKDIAGTDIKKGDKYYWWKFRYGSKHCSKVCPRPSQLTQSEFLSTIYGLNEQIEDLTIKNDLKEEIEAITNELDMLKDEQQERLDNMPEHLQESSSSGELLSRRIESVDEMISELEGIDTEIDEEKETDETDEDYTERINELKEEKLNEIKNISYEGE